MLLFFLGGFLNGYDPFAEIRNNLGFHINERVIKCGMRESEEWGRNEGGDPEGNVIFERRNFFYY